MGPVDNVDVDPVTGDLWLGNHPVPHKILDHTEDPSIPTPSQVSTL